MGLRVGKEILLSSGVCDEAYQQAAPFAPSLFVEIRKRMGATVFDGFHHAIIDAHEGKNASKQPETTAHSTPSDCAEPLEKPTEQVNETPSPQTPDSTEPTHQGRLIVDATVVEQAIHYPTDLSLLNEAREFSELIIDKLCVHLQVAQKPRTYRQSARKAYLAIAKQKRLSRKTLRRGIKQQLQYLRRNLGHIDPLLREIPEGKRLPLPRWLLYRYWVIQHLYQQQWDMYQTLSATDKNKTFGKGASEKIWASEKA